MYNMITRVEQSNLDTEKLEGIIIDKSDTANDNYNYSKVIVKKPWGQEYLIFENEDVAIWVLQIKSGAQTSMHCHPNKKTSLIVLEGEVVCSTLNRDYPNGANGGLMIPKGVFHQTMVPKNCAKDSWVMEIESPVNKRDLVRLKDKYGRVGMGYEKKSAYVEKLQNYNYLSLETTTAYHNIKKRFENCSIGVKKVTNQNDFLELLNLNDDDVISVLSGKLQKRNGSLVIEVGDTISISNLKKEDPIFNNIEIEILVVTKMDKTWKVSDYIMSFLNSQNVKDVFTVPGDSNVHLLDSLGKAEGLNYITNVTERSASLATESYAKTTNSIGILIVSSGGCGPNTIPGVANAWIDSVPMLIISGQARSDQDFEDGLRQLGNKALNIIDIVKPITKYAVKIDDPKSIKYHLEKAVYTAKEGRSGPVWIDLPIDIQGMLVNTDELTNFIPPDPPKIIDSDLDLKIKSLLDLIKNSKRPVIIIGNGIRNSKAEEELVKIINKFNIPILSTRKGSDLIENTHPLYFGRSGVFGQRKGNFIVQNSDLLISLGARLSIPQIGRNTKSFARAAKKVIIDIDEKELDKKTINADLKIKSDLKIFLSKILNEVGDFKFDYKEWLNQCLKWSQTFSPLNEGYKHKEAVNLYLFMNELSKLLEPKDIICVDGCTLTNTMMHIFQFKKSQRIICSTGIELPGFSIAGAIGACVGNNWEKIYCITEIQGLVNSLHDLQTYVERNLPIKIFVFQNNTHSHIRKIQEDHFAGRFVGTETEMKKSGTDIKSICKAFNLEYLQIEKPEQIDEVYKKIQSINGPVVCEVKVDPNQELIPRVGFNVMENGQWIAKPLEDMYPYLDKKVLKENMLIDLVE